MQLLCDGVILDLYDNTGIQFKHLNPLYAFDKLSCERTTEFRLPATPKNDGVFALARIPAYTGEGMRRKFAAQLQAGTVVKDGYLYISSFDGNDYAAVFVTGELVGLQAIRNAGKIRDLATYEDLATYGGARVLAPACYTQIWANVPYVMKNPEQEKIYPSIGIKPLLQRICTAQGWNMPTLPSSVQNMRLIPPSLSLPVGLFAIGSQIVATNQPQASYPSSALNTLTYSPAVFSEADAEVEVYVNAPSGQPSTGKFYRVAQFKCLTAMNLVFPEDFDDDWFVVDLNDADMDTCFYGDYSFSRAINAQIVKTGEPLAGRIVEFQAGDEFSIVNCNCYKNDDNGTVYNRGWFLNDSADTLTNTYALELPDAADVQDGDKVRLADNLPDVTVLELLRAIACASGTLLNYSNGTIVFDTPNLTDYTRELTEIISIKDIKRTFSDYAQRNYLRADNDEWVRESSDIHYEINNENLNGESELAKIVFSLGEDSKYAGNYLLDLPYETGLVYIPETASKFTLGIPKEDPDDAQRAQFMARAKLTKNSSLQALCDASTQIKAQVRMTLTEYDAIKPKDILLIRGTRYVWTERSWDDQNAVLQLQRIL